MVKKLNFKRNAIFQVVIAEKKRKTEVETVKENIRLSLLKSSLKKAKTIIDLDNDKATILGK